MLKTRLSSVLLTLIIVSLAVSPSITLGQGDRNLFLIGVMFMSPFILFRYHSVYTSDTILILFMLSIILIPSIAHPERLRWSTVLYSLMFGFTFLAYKRLVYMKYFTMDKYLTLLRRLIYAYFLVLLIQQFCVLTGLPIFNVSNYFPQEPWKLNSLAAEPSHSARIVPLLIYSYITIKELILGNKYNFHSNGQEDKWVWLAFLWTMLTMGSGTAFIFIIIVFLKFIRLKNLLSLVLIASIILVIVNVLGITALERTFKFFISVLTFDIHEIIKQDSSAAIRIVPQMIVANMVGLDTFDGWFGHGIDYSETFLSHMIPGLQENATGGGMFQLWLEYGFLSFILFVIFSFFSTYNKNDYLSIVFWFLMIFMYGVNNQIVWLAILILFTNKYFYQHNLKIFRKKDI